MNEGELHLQRERDRLHFKSSSKEILTDDEMTLLRKLDNWHIQNFRAMLAYSDVLDTWARQQLRDVDPFPGP
jgi:hypothetical protein